MLKFNSDYSSRFRILKGGKISLVVSALALGTTISFAAPIAGTVTSGTANISQTNNITNINQSTNKATIEWQDFSIASNEIVNFNQPDVNSITLNRVICNETSVINGALNANGQVWLLNSNGVLFSKDAKINTSGILATTAELSDSDFNSNNYNFKNSTSNSVINEGTIEVSNNGSVILASNEVQNTGTIKAVKGKVHLVGTDSYSLNLNGNSLVNLTVDKGVLDAMVENSGTIISDGGEIYLTTNAVDELLKGVVNNTGIIEANSLDGVTGYVELFAHGGTSNVAGTIEAIDGFVETSGRKLEFADDFDIKAGDWLIDPENIFIVSDDETVETFQVDIGAGLSSDNTNIKASLIEDTLKTTNITVETGTTSYGEGNINVNESITWDTNKKLTLDAHNNIYINKSITASNAAGQLSLVYGQGAVASGNIASYYINAPVNLKAGDNFFTTLGSDGVLTPWTVITDLGNAGSTTGTDLQGINKDSTSLSGNYVLGANINASATKTTADGGDNWNSGAGFDSLGDYTTEFTGNFDGLGHTISNLYINRPNDQNIGLFGYIDGASISNVNLNANSITGDENVGALVSHNKGIITNSYSTGDVNGSINVGGLVGINKGTITNSYSTGDVNGSYSAGGLVGLNYGTITNTYSIGDVNGSYSVGGLVGYNNDGTITNSFWDTDTTGITADDGIEGTTGITTAQFADASTFSSWDFDNTWTFDSNEDTVAGYEVVLRPYLKDVTADADKSTIKLFDSGFGTETSPYTITNWTQLQNIDNNAVVSSDYYYDLSNSLDNQTSDYADIIGSVTDTNNAGFDPIGDHVKSFKGTFDGLNHTISDLYINRPTQEYVGLFGFTDTATASNIGLLNNSIIGSNKVGTLIGYAAFSTIKNSYSTGAVTGNYYIGGLVGFDFSTIDNSYSTATVTGNNYVGGLVGEHSVGDITNSYATGIVTGNDYLGGLIGSNEGGADIKNSYSTGPVSFKTGATGDKIGGLVANLVGGMSGDGTVTNSFWNIDTSSQITSAGGIGKTSEEMQLAATYSDATWNITNDGTLNSNYKYPVLVTENGTTSWKIYKFISTSSNTNNNNDIEDIITTITNTTAIKVNPPKIKVPETKNTQTSVNLFSKPTTGQSVKKVTRTEVKSMQNSDNTVVPLGNGSQVSIINDGVNLPLGLEQEFYVSADEEGAK